MGNWKQERRHIQKLMTELEEASKYDEKHGTDRYRQANKKLDEAVRKQPWWRQANALYRHRENW